MSDVEGSWFMRVHVRARVCRAAPLWRLSGKKLLLSLNAALNRTRSFKCGDMRFEQ